MNLKESKKTGREKDEVKNKHGKVKKIQKET
jgi:hypothetical protein